MARIVLDEATGQVVGEIGEGDRIVRKASICYLDRVHVWRVEHFYKGNLREIVKWMGDLTPNEKALLFTVSPFVGYEDCCLKHENGNMLTFDDMVRLSCLSRSTVFETINCLITKDILYRGRNGRERQYFMNPWLFCKGNRINRVLQTMFRNYRIRVCQGVKWGNLREGDNVKAV